MKRLVIVALATLFRPATLPAAEPPTLSAAERDRLDAEARGQSAEADRLFKAGSFAEALPLYQAERRSRALLGDARYEAYAARAVGCCHEALGDPDEAVADWNDALALDLGRDDKGFAGYDLFLIGRAHVGRDRLAEGVKALRDAIPRLATAVDRDHEADAQLVLGATLLRMGKPADAPLDRSLALATALDDKPRQAAAWLELGRAASVGGDPGLAASRFATAGRMFTALGNRPEAARADFEQAVALADLDRLELALIPLARAVSAHQALGDDLSLAGDLALRAAAEADLGKTAEAVATGRLALGARLRAGDDAGAVDARVALADYLGQRSDWPSAAAALADALAVSRRQADPPKLIPLLLLAAAVERKAGRGPASVVLLDEARTVARTLHDPALTKAVADARSNAGFAPLNLDAWPGKRPRGRESSGKLRRIGLG